MYVSWKRGIQSGSVVIWLSEALARAWLGMQHVLQIGLLAMLLLYLPGSFPRSSVPRAFRVQ